MKKRNFFIVVVAAVFLGLNLFVSSDKAHAAAEGKPKGPKHIALFGHPYSPGDPYELGAKRFKEFAEKKSAGKVEVQIFPAGQLGDATEMFQAAQVGAIHFVGCSTGMIGSFLPEIDILRVPYFFPPDYDKVLKIMNYSPAGEELGKGLEKINIKGLRKISCVN